MVAVCELVGKKAGEAKDFVAFKEGIGLTKVKNYLNKHFQIEIDKFTVWQEIDDIKNLRNMIMHNNGRFEDRNHSAAEKLGKYMTASEWLSLDDTRHIVIDRNYFTVVDQSFRTFSEELFGEIEARELL